MSDWCANTVMLGRRRSIYPVRRLPPGRQRTNHHPPPEATAPAYSSRIPEIARAITSCWISDVPSKIVMIFASRCQRSTGASRT